MEDYTKNMGTHSMLDSILSMVENAYSELDDSKKYIKSAIHNKGIERKMADNMVVMSTQELGHYEMAVDGIEAVFARMKAENAPCYDGCYQMWLAIKKRLADSAV